MSSGETEDGGLASQRHLQSVGGREDFQVYLRKVWDKGQSDI